MSLTDGHYNTAFTGNSGDITTGWIFRDPAFDAADKAAFTTLSQTHDPSNSADNQKAIQELASSKDSIAQSFGKLMEQNTYSAETLNSMVTGLDQDMLMNKQTAAQAMLFAEQQAQGNVGSDLPNLQKSVAALNPDAGLSAQSKQAGSLFDNTTYSPAEKQALLQLLESPDQDRKGAADVLQQSSNPTLQQLGHYVVEECGFGPISDQSVKDTIFALDHDANLDSQSPQEAIRFAMQQSGNDSELSAHDKLVQNLNFEFLFGTD